MREGCGKESETGTCQIGVACVTILGGNGSQGQLTKPTIIALPQE